MDNEKVASNDIYYELVKIFPNNEGCPCYPYNIIIDDGSYEKK